MHDPQDDSTAAFISYITAINESVSQLDNMPAMSVSDIYALVTLMGLHLSSSDHDDDDVFYYSFRNKT